MRKETILRFAMSLKESFSNTFTFTVINKYGKGAVAQIAIVL